VNLSDPNDALRALIKTRASLKPDDVVTWFAGDVYAWQPDEAARAPIFGIEGYNVARAIEVEGGFDLLTREAVFYLDPRTRQIIDEWENPFTSQTVEVVHIWNDPVNQRLRAQMPWGPFRVPTTHMAGETTFRLDVFLAYPNPLPASKYPELSNSDTYQAAEIFGFTTSTSELQDEGVAGASSHVSWTRIAPWLPFMKMGSQQGHLVYHAEGRKLPGGFDELPDHIKARVEQDGPVYKTAPEQFSEPNATSWTEFKKRLS
jgi:hypothetical protein